MEILWALLLVLILLICWLLTIIGMPGNWLMIVAVLLYVLFGPPDGPLQVHWGWLIGLFVLAALGELFEFLAGVLGAAKMGGSKRGAALAFAGSLIGGVVGLFVGLPIPLIGQLVAALLFACAGALLGALIGEKWKGRDWKESFQIGGAAAVGRLLGTVGKVACGLLMIAIVCVALLF